MLTLLYTIIYVDLLDTQRFLIMYPHPHFAGLLSGMIDSWLSLRARSRFF